MSVSRGNVYLFQRSVSMLGQMNIFPVTLTLTKKRLMEQL